jgi:Raf kinase inhibitor-like YbhB/YbcL family protein
MLDLIVALSLSSPVFEQNGSIPKLYTCQGKDVSPRLNWNGLPNGTKSVALIVDDPDAPDPQAPARTWVHWVVADLPDTSSGVRENASRGGLPDGAREGKNDWGTIGWRGPCPPVGRHRYFFKLYALDTVLFGLVEPTKAELERAMAGHVLAHSELMGTYEKSVSTGGRTAAA